MDAQNSPRRRNTFLTIWLGQVVSLAGSGLTGFALGVWVFQQSGSATQFALIGLAAVLPRVLLSPLAGVVVDRWDRRRVMILSDAGAGLSTVAIVLLLWTNRLGSQGHSFGIWPIYALTFVNAAFGTLQWPAFAATTSLLVPKKNLARANGLVQLGQAASEILSPALAGVLMGIIRLEGVILIDVATFIFAVITLLLVRLPKPQASAGRGPGKTTLRSDLTVGWRYISARPGLKGLLLLFTVISFFWGMVGALITPMILGWASSDELGLIIAVAGAGMFAGSLLLSVWGGPRRWINGVLSFELLSGICFMLIGLRPSLWLVAAGAFGAHVTIAVVYGSNQAIWQSKVTPDVQGRVFATQQMVGRAAAPLAYLLAGPLADRVFNPLLTVGGPLADGIGQVLGTGPGRGIGLIFLLMGAVKIAVTLIGRSNPRVRNVEEELPDAVLVPADSLSQADL